MKVLVVLSLLSLAAAKPQFVLPYNVPQQIAPTVQAFPQLLTPTVQTTGNVPVIDTYTAAYQYAYPGFPFVQSAVPFPYRFPIHYSPLASAANQVTANRESVADENSASQAVESRQKRSADPEPEADPAQVLYTTGVINTDSTNFPRLAAIPTAQVGYQYTGLPAAVTNYAYPQQQTFPVTSFAGFTPYSGFQSFTGVNPYNAFPLVSIASNQNARNKRSADPEANPQVFSTGFSYPAISGYPQTSAYTIQNVPSAYRQIPTTYAQIPTTFNVGAQYQQFFPGTNRAVYG